MTEEEPAAEVEAEVEADVDAEVDAQVESDAPQALLDAVAAYEAAAADFRAAAEGGGDVDAAAAALSAAEADLADICAALGQADLLACVAMFDIDLELIDPNMLLPAPDAEAPAQDEVVDEAPAEGDIEGADIVTEGEEVPLDDVVVEEYSEEEVILDDGTVGEVAPEGYSAEELAPLLDSEKDQAAGAFADEEVTEAPVAEEAPVEGEAPVEEAPVEEEAVATPTSDEEAQPALTQEVVSITVEEGERVDAETLALSERRSTERVGRDWERRERPQNVNIVNQIGLSVVFQTGNTYYIETPDTPRLWYEDDRDYYVENLSNGRTREVVVRSDGTQIVTIRDRFGDIVRRSRIEPDGREFLLVYVDDSYQRYDDQGRWIDPGRELPPLRLNIPAREYVLDASFAQEDELEQFLYQPPVERLTRYYTVEEVKRSSRVRDMVRRLEIGDLTFETASANIPQDQVRSLSAVANAMLDMLENNPGETFLIEGHTDAVGDDLYNLELSDQRAQSVAYALTRVYGVPAENLATQGYGERYLKINTQQAERLNRRVTIRRITPLVTPLTPTASN